MRACGAPGTSNTSREAVLHVEIPTGHKCGNVVFNENRMEHSVAMLLVDSDAAVSEKKGIN